MIPALPINRASKRQRRPSPIAACETLESRAYLSAVTFQAPTLILDPASGITPIAEASTDFGNGHQDVAALYTGGSGSPQSIAILLNNGFGVFTNAQTLTAGNESKVVRFGDILGNGRQDLLVNSVLEGKLYIFDANGDGTFQNTSQRLAYGTPQGTTPIAANNDFQLSDLTGNNGLPDVVVADDVAHQTIVFMNQGGSFTEHILPISLSNFVIGDFTGDGKPDIAYINGGNLGVLAGHGDGTFTTTPVNYSLNIPASYKTSGNLITGNFSGSGRADVAVELDNPSSQPTAAGDVSVLINQSGGGFATAKLTATPPNPVGITAGDFNGDGKQDILVSGNNGATTDLLISNGDGTFADQSLSLAHASGINQPAVGDYNGDGKLDLVTADGSSGLFLNLNGVKPVSTLVPTVSGSVPTTSFIAGQKFKPIREIVKLTNNSATLNTDSVTVTMVLSTSADGSGGTTVATYRAHLKLKAHKFIKAPLTISSFPTSVNGTLHLVAVLSDASGILATVDTSHTITVGPPSTDLSATIAKIPATTKAGKKAAVTINITQLGNIPITGSLPVEFFLSTDTTLDSADINIGVLPGHVSIKPGKPSKLVLSPTIPVGPTGDYHIIAVVDPQNTRTDTNLANNTAVSAGTMHIG